MAVAMNPECGERVSLAELIAAPVEAIKFVMEQRNLTVKDLVPYIGQPNRVYEVLSHKRPLTMAMVWKLHTGLGIPAESLIKQAA